jgi:hypothetical protein
MPNSMSSIIIIKEKEALQNDYRAVKLIAFAEKREKNK